MLAKRLDALPRGPEKPLQGRIRRATASPLPRARISRWIASENVRRYDWTASSGSVVANDPVNGTDPTGLACVGQDSDYCDRSDAYREIQSDPAIDSKTDFFEGVATMTDNLGNLDLPFGESFAGLDEDTASALNDLSGQIFEFNKGQAELVRSGEISGTRSEVNAQLVAREQGFIEGKLAQMPAEMRANVVGAMTDSANGAFANSLMYATDPIPALAASATRSQLRGPINFGNIRHRIQFGVNLMRLVSGTR